MYYWWSFIFIWISWKHVSVCKGKWKLSMSLRIVGIGEFSFRRNTRQNFKKVFRFEKHYESNLRSMIPLSFKRWIIFYDSTSSPQTLAFFMQRSFISNCGHNAFIPKISRRSFLWMMLYESLPDVQLLKPVRKAHSTIHRKTKKCMLDTYFYCVRGFCGECDNSEIKWNVSHMKFSLIMHVGVLTWGRFYVTSSLYI